MYKEILEDIGEKELINRLGKFMPKNQTSDDCALIKTKNDNLLVNNDCLVENVHFNDMTICAQDLRIKIFLLCFINTPNIYRLILFLCKRV